MEPLQNTLELGKTYNVSNAIVADEKPSFKLYGTDTHLTFRRDTQIYEVQEDNTAMVEGLYEFTSLDLCKNSVDTTTALSMYFIIYFIINC